MGESQGRTSSEGVLEVHRWTADPSTRLTRPTSVDQGWTTVQTLATTVGGRVACESGTEERTHEKITVDGTDIASAAG